MIVSMNCLSFALDRSETMFPALGVSLREHHDVPFRHLSVAPHEIRHRAFRGSAISVEKDKHRKFLVDGVFWHAHEIRTLKVLLL